MQLTRTQRIVFWIVVGSAVAAALGGPALGLFRFRWWDRVLHAHVGLAVTLVAGVVLYGRVLTGRRDHLPLLVLTTAAIGVAVGAAWEVAEWTVDQVARGNLVKSKRDSILDLVMDGVGALAGAVLAAAFAPRDDPPRS